ncbi:hypothetical protein D9758_010509 [Tetrapyrgos nigripes]|uniref:Ubiquinol-cytochrome c chaperone domain-containing protein n=1 Tax=Tetrapyrgos nigripes TaxID=182062 RepID=A0A8H5FV40_9AGAR|nr:hypothetical protein D9758_010509 [Tetrapyrgos nigripes]
MLSRSAFLRSIRCSQSLLPAAYNSNRYLASKAAVKTAAPQVKNSQVTTTREDNNVVANATPAPPSSSSSDSSSSLLSSISRPVPKKSWLTHKIETSPTWRYWFMQATTLLGYHTPKQVAGRRAFFLYQELCATVPDANRAFWQDKCDLPPTFQSWFTVTNLHVWMLTVRLRALPELHGRHYVQGLIDHFFLDIEDRIRAILQPSIPPSPPYTFATDFYINPNIPKDGKLKRGSRAPERLVTRQMKIFKEQWMGMGMSFDHGLVTNDMELAGAIWRNLLGARGAQGIAYPSADGSFTPQFRRSINLVGGMVENPEKVDFEKEQTRDDGSGVHDYSPTEVDRYLRYPELMVELVSYIRREIARLEAMSDEEIMEGFPIDELGFGRIGGRK